MNDLTELLSGPAYEIAQRLLGCQLVRQLDGQSVTVTIVETEAYDQTDAASHSYRGLTPRTDVMFGPAGHLYVYFTYGMHYCCNIVVGAVGTGAAVLIRAVEPLNGANVLGRHRPRQSGIQLTNGPAKLCQALTIDRTMNGHDLTQLPLQLVMQPALAANEIMQTTRIGISQAKDIPWRFYVKDNLYVSKTI